VNNDSNDAIVDPIDSTSSLVLSFVIVVLCFTLSDFIDVNAICSGSVVAWDSKVAMRGSIPTAIALSSSLSSLTIDEEETNKRRPGEFGQKDSFDMARYNAHK
jgi:hypothetical protein